jgi:hypothetical protein
MTILICYLTVGIYCEALETYFYWEYFKRKVMDQLDIVTILTTIISWIILILIWPYTVYVIMEYFSEREP